jgi:hypothetical protein
MKRQLLLSSLVLFVGLNFCAYSQNLQWAKGMGGTGIDVGTSIISDASGNVYTTGAFQGTVDFDPGEGTFNLTSAGMQDIFISKLDASGNFIWAKTMGSTIGDSGLSIALDYSGNVYTTGAFQGTVDFDPGEGTFNLTSAGMQDIFISKLDASGNFIWAKTMGSTIGDSGLSIALDYSGNVYTTGYFYGTADFDPNIDTFNLTSSGGVDIFISKLDTYGNFLWAKALGSSNGDYGYSIAIDTLDNVFTTGYFQAIVDFDPGVGTFNLTSTGGTEIFISKLDSSGNFLWAKRLGGSTDDEGHSITIDGLGNVYITGLFSGTADFDPNIDTFNLTSSGGVDIFISKLDTYGNFLWAKGIGSTSSDDGRSIDIDGLDNVYTTGYFNGTADFDPGTGTYNLTTANGIDVFISKLDASGNFIWAKQLGGTSDDYGNSIIIDIFDNFYTTGYFNETADFDPSTGTFNLNSVGDSDIFITKFGYNNTGIENEFDSSEFGVFPNPSNGIFTIINKRLNYTNAEIYNIFGQNIYSIQMSSEKVEIDLSKYPKGFYFYQLKWKSKIIGMGKIIIE